MIESFNPTEWLTTKEAAELTGYNVRYLRQLINEGKIDAIKRGGIFWIDKESVADYANTMKRLGRQSTILGAPPFCLFLIGIVPLSILLTWVYNHNDRSTLAAVLVHFAYNLAVGLVHPFSVTINLFQVILLYITAVGMVLADRSRMASHSGNA